MKSSMKKLAVFVMIAAIAIFIAAATASAFDRDDYPKAIRGQYASTGAGTCVTAICGFGPGYMPYGDPTQYVIQTNTWNGVFTFELDGTGTVSRTVPTVTLLNTDYNIPGPSAGIFKDTWDFKYEIKHGGKITLTEVPGTHTAYWASGPAESSPLYPTHLLGYNRTGIISPDGETIELNGGLPDIITYPDWAKTFGVPFPGCPTGAGPMQGICNASEVLTRQY